MCILRNCKKLYVLSLLFGTDEWGNEGEIELYIFFYKSKKNKKKAKRSKLAYRLLTEEKMR